MDKKCLKILILTDSVGNPRPFPDSEKVELEETYPYILRNYFKDSVFWQLSYGNITTEQLVSQAAGYLSHWNPDIIIIHSGIIDSRPEAFSDIQKALIDKLPRFLAKRARRWIKDPRFIKMRQINRVNLKSFRKTAKKVKFIFEKSDIFWLEICAGDGYERVKPGVHKRIKKYNNVLYDIFEQKLVMISRILRKKDGFNQDNLHWNKTGHKIVADLLIDKINKASFEGA